MRRRALLWVLGGPGSGKGTVCSRLCAPQGRSHISAGELLRRAEKDDAELRALLAAGSIVPSSVTVGLLHDALAALPAGDLALVDGFPRNEENLGGWLSAAKEGDVDVDVLGTLFLECPDEELLARLRRRAETSGRSDDTEETMQRRLETFHRQTEPVMRLLAEQWPVYRVDATPGVEEVVEAAGSVLSRSVA